MQAQIRENLYRFTQVFMGLVITALVASHAIAARDSEDSEDSEALQSSRQETGRSGLNKVTICHISRQDPSKGGTMEVYPGVLSRHLAHGDYLGPCAIYGDKTSLGDGYAQTYVQIDKAGTPYAIGLEFTESMLSNLPYDPPQDGNNCWDINGDGTISVEPPNVECAGGHQRILFFPPQVTKTPFKWFLLNWNPMGHAPIHIYDRPHFDIHFYIMDYLARNFIRPGPCGIVVNCDDFATATKPVPSQFIPSDYRDFQAVEPRMGNHLVDITSPEFTGGVFTHTFVYGAYDGSIIFLEPMITLEFLETQPNSCFSIKQPSAYEIGGFYPTEYCIRYSANRKKYTISLEKFKLRQAF